jgi:hypothetical protein
MKRNALYNLIASLPVLVATSFAVAEPISGSYADDTRGDVVPGQSLTRELGDAAHFSPADAFVYHDHRLNAGVTVGVSDDGIANDWTVHLTNVSAQAWTNLFFVADLGASIGNADGTVEDAGGAPGVFTDAFRVDATGSNVNLFHESIAPDGILQPGEEWEFGVMNFNTGAVSMPPVFITPGQFAGSSQIGPTGGINSGNASIIAIAVVPEPTTLCVLGLAGLAMLMRRSKRETSERPTI